MTRRLPWIGLCIGLALSGLAGLVNQVVWQRGLKVFLGGSETLSSMITVLVFLLGLGLGAGLAARRASSLRNPLRALVFVELLLAAANSLVALVLGLDIADSVAAAQRIALSVGVPLHALYALGSAVVLLPPTLLMGMTIPLSSEASQRQLAGQTPRFIQMLIVVNTMGATLGAYGASAWLLPVAGQAATLFMAAGCNVLAAVVIGLLARVPPAEPRSIANSRSLRLFSRDEVLGAVLGFLALGFQMVLFRILALGHYPVPTTFATGLASFLLAWSLGVWISSIRQARIQTVALLSFVAIEIVLVVFLYEFWVRPLPLPFALLAYAGPCLMSGLMYGALVSRVAREWGRDMGRLSVANTIGSCLGIVVFTLIGHEMPVGFTLSVIGIAFFGVAAWESGSPWIARTAAVAAFVVAVIGVSNRYTERQGTRTYWGRDGVVQILPSRDVRIDGLWHSKLSKDGDHVGQVYNWLMGFAAALAHDGPVSRALVVGGGAGISSASLAGLGGVQVDNYEINHTLRRVLEDDPRGTLGALHAPGITWRWRDARVGLALDPGTYDIILSAPLHLRQAGSSLLVSREYLRLVKSRLSPGGVLAVYSHEGNQAQAELVQATINEVFPHRATWYDGVLTIASDRPIDLSETKLRQALDRPERLFQEAKALDASLYDDGGLWSWYDGVAPPVAPGSSVITDDRPLVEYPLLADRWMRRAN